MAVYTELKDDPCLQNYGTEWFGRTERAKAMENRLTGGERSLADFANGHHYFGLHRTDSGWVIREWAPNATAIFLVGEATDWQESDEFALTRIDEAGIWQLCLPAEALVHGQLFRYNVHWAGGSGERLPAYTRRAVQDESTHIFNAQVWAPQSDFHWHHSSPAITSPLIYEAHVGMAQEGLGVGSYEQFRKEVLPRVKAAGYNTVQLMAIMEHPYYGSFGYHVSNFFAASSRFGTPEELKALVDEAHGLGLAVIMDIVHSHSVSNENEGLARFDGTDYQYFHGGARGHHHAWDSKCFDYGKTEVLHFLLSNCKFWLEEYQFDGFRFDGVTSMMYFDHGLGTAFGHYDQYFKNGVEEDAVAYLALANKLIHQVKPSAFTIAEDVSGMPGLASPVERGGIGFDFKLAMGVPDFWYKQLELADEQWDVEHMWFELTNRRPDERSISYAECHDQAIVGSKTISFHLMDAEMYHAMNKESQSLIVDRGLALHKMIRLFTLITAGDGYLNFMGNEFGHPEWIDFPREGNGWSYHYARRQWSLAENPFLKYQFLGEFDREIIHLFNPAPNLGSDFPVKSFGHTADQVIAVKRGDYLCVFNFSPTNSYTDYPVDVNAGSYELLFSSDDNCFGGHGRLESGTVYNSHEFYGREVITFYLPTRSVLVLKQQHV